MYAQTLETFGKELEAKKDKLSAFQTKYKIRVKVCMDLGGIVFACGG